MEMGDNNLERASALANFYFKINEYRLNKLWLQKYPMYSKWINFSKFEILYCLLLIMVIAVHQKYKYTNACYVDYYIDFSHHHFRFYF